jgi:hypothetical protein
VGTTINYLNCPFKVTKTPAICGLCSEALQISCWLTNNLVKFSIEKQNKEAIKLKAKSNLTTIIQKSKYISCKLGAYNKSVRKQEKFRPII